MNFILGALFIGSLWASYFTWQLWQESLRLRQENRALRRIARLAPPLFQEYSRN